MARKRVRRVTQADIAKHAGVSTAVVSLVLNNSANGSVKISEQTQQRVREAIQELRYVPNTAARQLARGRTNVIGVFTYEPIFPLNVDNFYQRFLIGIEEAASNLNYNLLLLTGSLENGRRSIYQHGTNQLLAAEGALLLGSYEDREELRRLWEDGYPFVFVGRREIDGQNIPASAADYAGASKHLLEQFILAGHRSVDILYPAIPNESHQDRLKGTRTAAASHPDLIYSERLITEQEITAQWLRSRTDNGVTAFVTTDMPSAVKIMELAKSLGIRIPEEISIGSLGNADNPLLSETGITMFEIPHREMGAKALELLAAVLSQEEPPPYPITIPCTFVPGVTLAPPPTARPSKRKGGEKESVVG